MNPSALWYTFVHPSTLWYTLLQPKLENVMTMENEAKRKRILCSTVEIMAKKEHAIKVIELKYNEKGKLRE